MTTILARTWFGLLPLLLVLCADSATAAAAKPPLDGVKRVVFLGDSITHAGQYVEFVEAWFRTRHPARAVEFLDIGLPSETVSGLSEDGHAGGKFPRPDLHERLERVLAKSKPDLVVACYGMNCGIYLPFAEERFAKYRDGMERLRKACAKPALRTGRRCCTSRRRRLMKCEAASPATATRSIATPSGSSASANLAGTWWTRMRR